MKGSKKKEEGEAAWTDTNSLLSRSFSLCLYLLLLGLLGGMIVHGPLLKLLSEETEFQVDRVGPEEVPVPTVSICRMGAAKERTVIVRDFYQDPNSTTQGLDLDGFYSLGDYYKIGHLHRTMVNYYQEPLWDIGPEDWNRSLSNPGLIGECYSLDISSRINPAELFMLNLSLNNSVDCNYYLVLRESKETFFAYPNQSGRDFIPEGVVVQPGTSINILVTTKIVRYLKDCQDDGPLTECADEWMDRAVPACTAAMYESGSCSPLGLAARAGKVAELHLLTHDAFAAATGCKRTCEKREYHLTKTINLPLSMTMDSTEAAKELRINIAYVPQEKVEYHKEKKAYELTDFWADAGGLSGLLLGLCIYDLVLKLKSCLAKIARACNKS